MQFTLALATYSEAVDYCEQYGARLPTSDEWLEVVDKGYLPWFESEQAFSGVWFWTSDEPRYDEYAVVIEYSDYTHFPGSDYNVFNLDVIFDSYLCARCLVPGE